MAEIIQGRLGYNSTNQRYGLLIATSRPGGSFPKFDEK